MSILDAGRSESGARNARLRWDLVLPLAALAVAATLVFLAFATVTARSERRSLTLEGKLNRLAREVELELRETGPDDADAVLERVLVRSDGLLRGLVLLGGDGRAAARAGEAEGPGALEVDLFLGPAWHGRAGRPDEPGMGPGRGASRGPARGGGMGRGRRVLRLVPAPAALRRPWTEGLLLPVVLFAGAALVGLSVVGGRLLIRRQREVELEAERQRLEGLARAGAGLAHQLRTPLATIKGTSQLLLEGVGAEADRDALGRVVEQAERMERLLGDLLDYARPTGAEPGPVALDALGELLPELVELDPRVRVVVEPGTTAEVDPDHLRQILLNLVDNALDAGPGGSPVEVVARGRARSPSVAAGDGEMVEITVADRGRGPGDDPERLFEPYVTSRADGTGLGLPIARSLARANGGEVLLTARPGGGTVATLLLPGEASVSPKRGEEGS